MAANKQGMVGVLLANKKMWLIPLAIAIAVFAAMLLLGNNDTPTPYIYNIH